MEHIHSTYTVSCEKIKMVSFRSSIMQNIILTPARSKFPMKLICCIAFESTLALFLYLNLLISFFNNFLNKLNLANSRLCNHPNFSNVYHMLLYHFWLVDKIFFSTNHNIAIFYSQCFKKKTFVTYQVHITFKCHKLNPLYCLKTRIS